jgi:hypothetical protein
MPKSSKSNAQMADQQNNRSTHNKRPDRIRTQERISTQLLNKGKENIIHGIVLWFRNTPGVLGFGE